MRKFLVFDDGVRYELTPLTYEEFKQLNRWVGGSDSAFNQFLSHNNFHEFDSFDDELTSKNRWNGKGWEPIVKIELEEGEPKIDWSITYGG